MKSALPLDNNKFTKSPLSVGKSIKQRLKWKCWPLHTMWDGPLDSLNNIPQNIIINTTHQLMNLAADNYWLKISQVGRAVTVYSRAQVPGLAGRALDPRSPGRRIRNCFVIKLNPIIIPSSAKITKRSFQNCITL